jgi:phage tail sheath protein FI
MATLASIKSPGVYIQEMPAGSRPIEGVGTAVAAFIGVTADGPFNQAIRVTNWAQYRRTFGEWVDGAYLPHAVYQFFTNGGGACYVSRIGQSSGAEAPHAGAELTSSVKAGLAVYRIEALESGVVGEGITVTIDPVRAISTSEAGEGQDGEGEGRQDGEPSYSITVRRGDQSETFEGITGRKGRNDLVTMLQTSTLVRARELGNAAVAERIPGGGTVALTGGAALPAQLSPEDYLGDEVARSGIAGLMALPDVTMVCTPDLMAAYEAGQIDSDGVRTVQNGLIQHCESMMDRMAILDTPKGLNAQQVHEWVTEKAQYSSAYAALYWPWVSFYDPQAKRARFMPPSGALAGIWGRNDDTRGVHKAPANEVVAGALDLELNVTRGEHDLLNPAGINVIRSFPGRGIVVWGARTLADDTTWRYINVRRLFNYIESSILLGTQWTVFEPNDLDLWQRIKRTLNAFLLGLWRDGALFGATPDQAFYVKCDAETNPPDVIDAGFVVVEVYVAPVKPAEFVLFRISQLPTGGSVQE